MILHELQPERAEFERGGLDYGVGVLREGSEPVVAGPGIALDDLHPGDVAVERDGRVEVADGKADVVQHIEMLAWRKALGIAEVAQSAGSAASCIHHAGSPSAPGDAKRA